MSKKRILAAIPIALLPYFALFAPATLFLSTKCPFFRWVMESVFRGNALYLTAVFFLCCFLVAALSAVCFLVSICKKWDSLSLAKIFMIVKLLQVPAYVLIFACGVLFSITIFTVPFSVALLFSDCVSVFSTGLGVASAAINAIRQDIFKPKEILWVIIAQFVFCADVVASMILYIKLKNRKADTQKQTRN